MSEETKLGIADLERLMNENVDVEILPDGTVRRVERPPEPEEPVTKGVPMGPTHY